MGPDPLARPGRELPMSRCTISGSPFHPARPSRSGSHPSIHRSSALRRLAGLVALTALLSALPAPALAAQAYGSPVFSGAVVLDWIQSFLARLGVAGAPVTPVRDSPTSFHERLGDEMDPNGARAAGASYESGTSERLFLGDEMDPNG